MPNVLIYNANSICNKECLSVQVSQGEILYDELEKQNIILPHGCLSGSCGACCTEILDGMEYLSNPSIVETNTLEDLIKDKGISNLRLTCRARVLGDISIKILK